MREPRDIVDIPGVSPAPGGAPAPPATGARTPQAWLSIWFRCCHTYGRLYRNRAQTMYEGRCPRCGAHVSARIGAQGTNRRMFEAG